MEFGYLEGHHGVMFTTLSTNSQTSDSTHSGVDVVFNDPDQGAGGNHYLDSIISRGTATFVPRFPGPPATPPERLSVAGGTPVFGRPAVVFNTLYMQNKSRLGGVEALYIYRPSQLHDGSTLDITMGGRYLQLKDQFWVDGRGGTLADSYWNTTSHNDIAGPEIGLRWYKPHGRFAFTAEGRFTAGINSQTIQQDGALGSTINLRKSAMMTPIAMSPNNFNSSVHYTEFSPIVELRLQGQMQLTNLISVKAGWTAMWISNVARASDMVEYTLPNMGITNADDANRQNVFVNGLTLGVELNH
jgi:hypothetical protein